MKGNTFIACTVLACVNTQAKTVHAINVVYDSPNDSDKCDTTNDTYLPMRVSAMSDDTDIPDAQRQCPALRTLLRTWNKVRYLMMTSPHARQWQRVNTIRLLCLLHTPRQEQKSKLQLVTQQLCLPGTLRDTVVKAYHDNNSHIGLDKLYESIRLKYYWPRMYADLSEYVCSCTECQQTKQPTHHKKAPLEYLPVEHVFARFHLDYLGPLPLSNGFRYLLVAIDSTSVSSEIHPTKTCDADITCAVPTGVHVTSLPGGGPVWKDKETEWATWVAVERSLS